jgi:hypothetical protein
MPSANGPVILAGGRLGQGHGFRPIAQQQVADRQQAFGFPTWIQLVAPKRVAKGRPGKARGQEFQAMAAVAIECGGGPAEQAQITFTPPACVRPRLTSAAGWAPHVVARWNWHLAQSEIREWLAAVF